MKVLYLPNWIVKKTKDIPNDLRYADYVCEKVKFWIFRYFKRDVHVDVIDISSMKWIENFEKKKLKFYIVQAFQAIPKLNKYDFVISDGMQSAAVIALWHKMFHGKYKHIVFDVGSFNGGKSTGISTKMLQFASTSIDGFIYHTPTQLDFYKKYYPWIIEKSTFMELGIDTDFFDDQLKNNNVDIQLPSKFILCVGYQKRDIDTLLAAYNKIKIDNVKLVIVGKLMDYNNENIISFPAVPNGVLCNMIEKATLCVLPLDSYNYSYGQLTLLQQMYFGKAIIAARVDSLIHYVKENEDCLLYKVKDAGELAKKINSLLNDKQLRDKLGHAATMSVRTKYSGKAMGVELENYLFQFWSISNKRK